jgi:hypothetical protein
MTSTIFALLIAAVGAATTKYFDTDYVATLTSFEYSTSDMSISLHRTSTNPRESIGSISMSLTSQYYGNGTLQVSSSLAKYGGTMVLTNYTSNTRPTCTYATNASIGGIFDFSSNGWLARPDTVVSTLGNGQVLYQLSCLQVYNSTTGVTHYTNEGWCYEIDLSRGVISSSSGAGQTLALVVSTSGEPSVLMVAGGSYRSTYLFRSFTPIASAPVVDADPICLSGTRCANNTTPLKVQLYRQHGNSTLFKQLNNTNLASLFGEAYWLCEYHVASPLISLFQLTVDSRWSTYSLCNAGQCSVSDYASAFGVGRQFNDGQRICSFQDNQEPDDSNVTCSGSWCQGAGAWYSFPQLGACPLGMPVGTNNCTWQQDYRTIKTITLDCLKNVSYLNFDCSNQTFAFMASELTRGFKICPDVQGSVGEDMSDEEFFAADQQLPLIDDIAEREADNERRFGATPFVTRKASWQKRAANFEAPRPWI